MSSLSHIVPGLIEKQQTEYNQTMNKYIMSINNYFQEERDINSQIKFLEEKGQDQDIHIRNLEIINRNKNNGSCLKMFNFGFY